MPAPDGAVKVRLANVLTPKIFLIFAVAVLLVKETLLKVWPLPVRVAAKPDKLICEVPALNVRFVDKLKFMALPLRERFSVLASRFMVRVFELDDTRSAAVIVNPDVVNVP